MKYFVNGVETTEEVYNDFIRTVDDTESFFEYIEELEKTDQQLSLF